MPEDVATSSAVPLQLLVVSSWLQIKEDKGATPTPMARNGYDDPQVRMSPCSKQAIAQSALLRAL